MKMRESSLLILERKEQNYTLLLYVQYHDCMNEYISFDASKKKKKNAKQTANTHLTTNRMGRLQHIIWLCFLKTKHKGKLRKKMWITATTTKVNK